MFDFDELAKLRFGMTNVPLGGQPGAYGAMEPVVP